MTLDHLLLKLWSENKFQMMNLGFRSDNPEKKVGTVCPIWFKKSPPFPNAMLIRVMLPEAAPGRPTLIDGGRGSIWQMMS